MYLQEGKTTNYTLKCNYVSVHERMANMIRKTRTTQKWLKNSFKNVYGASYNDYCDLHYMLPDARWYTAGVYGWNADVYLLDIDTVLVAGYRPIGQMLQTEEIKKLLEEHK